MLTADRRATPVAIRTGAIFASMELSKSTWLVTSLSPGAGERMSRHTIRASDIAGRFERSSLLTARAKRQARRDLAVIVIQKAGLGVFWIHRCCRKKGSKPPLTQPLIM